MCEIQFIKNMDKNITLNEIKLIKNMLFMGSEFNNDGYGIFSDKFYYKTNKQFNNKDLNKSLLNKFLGSNFLIAHNRFKTSGDNRLKNTQPITFKNVTVIHNGIFNKDSDKKSDTYIFSNKLNDLYNKDKNPLKAIEGSLNYVYGGSYSLFVFFNKINKLYYLKNSLTNFKFYLIKDTKTKNNLIVGNTNFKNLNLKIVKYGVFKINNNRYKVYGGSEGLKDNTIYEINKDGLKDVKKIEGIKTNIVYNPYNYIGYSDYEAYNKDLNDYIKSKNRDLYGDNKNGVKKLFNLDYQDEEL